MSDLANSKTCPSCAETIKSAARICPFCQKRQKGFPTWLILTSVSSVFASVIFSVGFVGLATNLWPLNPAKFSEHKTALSILQPTISKARKTPEMWTKDLGTNAFEKKWSVHELEIRFLDEEGNSISRQTPYLGGAIYSGPSVWVSGFITNSSKYAWIVQQLEARFYDKAGELIDVQNVSSYDSIFVAPNSQSAFRIELSGSTIVDTNVDLTIRVSNAIDGNSL